MLNGPEVGNAVVRPIDSTRAIRMSELLIGVVRVTCLRPVSEVPAPATV